MRRGKPETIGDLLPLFVKEFKLEQGLMENRVLNLWEELTGRSVARVTTGKWVKNRKLYVSLSSSVVRHELFMMCSEITKEINRRLNRNMIDEIVLK
jgi:predicted nucleic acid-binding Zn ribbon protein